MSTMSAAAAAQLSAAKKRKRGAGDITPGGGAGGGATEATCGGNPLPANVAGVTPEGLYVASHERYSVAFGGLKRAELRRRLLEDGVVVVTGVLTEEEVVQGLQGFRADLQQLVLRKDVSGQPLKPWQLQPKGSGGSSLWKSRGCALTENAQRRRLNGNARQVFAMLYDLAPEDLVISCDAYAVRLAAWEGRHKSAGGKKAKGGADPVQQASRRALGSTLKLHQDATRNGAGGGIQDGSMVHGLKDKGLFPHCVQGALIYREETTTTRAGGGGGEGAAAAAGGGDTLVYPGFIACPGPPEPLHDGLNKKSDWYVLSPQDYNSDDHGDVLQRLRYFPAPAGSLRLWRSDVIHGNTLMHPSLSEGLEPWEVTRAAQFVCWGPRSLVTVEDARCKLEWAQKGGSHNHWPTICSRAMRGGHMSDDGSWLRTLSDAAIRLLPEQIAALGPLQDPAAGEG